MFRLIKFFIRCGLWIMEAAIVLSILFAAWMLLSISQGLTPRFDVDPAYLTYSMIFALLMKILFSTVRRALK